MAYFVLSFGFIGIKDSVQGACHETQNILEDLDSEHNSSF